MSFEKELRRSEIYVAPLELLFAWLIVFYKYYAPPELNQMQGKNLRTLVPQPLRTLEKKHLQIETLFHTFALFLKLLSVITKGGGIDPMKP
jgi:hypothetical protein